MAGPKQQPEQIVMTPWGDGEELFLRLCGEIDKPGGVYNLEWEGGSPAMGMCLTLDEWDCVARAILEASIKRRAEEADNG